jgi:hypothetical protein
MCILILVFQEEKDGKKRWVGSSIEGVAMDKFHSRGAGHIYLTLRNDHGAGTLTL